MNPTLPSDLLQYLKTRALPKRLLRVGLALTSTFYSLRPDSLLAKSSPRAGTPERDWPIEGGLTPLTLPERPTPSRGELFFIDAGVADPGAFWLAAPKGGTVVCIPAGVDSWHFMAQEAARFQGLGAIHIVSHGQPGAVVLNGQHYAATDLETLTVPLQQLGRALGAHLARHEVRRAHARVQPELHEVERQLRVVTHDDQVARQRHAQPRADGRPFDGRDDGHAHVEHRQVARVEREHEAARLFEGQAAQRVQHRQVSTRRERAARSRQHHRAHVGPAQQLAHAGRQRVTQLGRHRVPARHVVQRQQRHACFDLQLDRRTHGPHPLLLLPAVGLREWTV
jgi:hypothetical protein